MIAGIYNNPTTIFFGLDAERQLGKEILKITNKILLLYGGDSFNKFQTGSKIRAVLESHEIDFIELGGVEADPSAELVYQAITLCKQKDIQFILAVGGASVIDTAKAIAIGTPYAGDFFDFFEGKQVAKDMLALGTVLTISGAGSESNNAAVIAKNGHKYSCSSPVMFPTFAIMNPELTITVPVKLTACGIVDSISHVLERYFSNSEHVDTSDRICEALLQSLMEIGPRLLASPENVDLRAEAMWAAKLAHDNTAGFGRKQDWATHTIAHEIGARTKKTHGEILAVVFPAWMKFVSLKNADKFIQFAQRVFHIDSTNQSAQAVIDAGINAYRNFLHKMGMPTALSELDLNNAADFDDIAYHCSLTTQSGTIGNFVRLSKQDIVELLTSCA